jgi:uncharacterized protein (TIGR03083 family)
VSVNASALDLTPMLAPERAALLELLRGLSAEDWLRPTECPAWNVKEIALHILGDDFSLLSRQRDASTDSLTLFAAEHPGLRFRELLDGFNEQWVNASAFFSTELVIDLLRLVGEWSEALYCGVGLDTVSHEPVTFFASNVPSPYWQVVAREYVERFVHQSQIRRAIGAPELEGELVTAAARVVVHALAAWLRDDAPAVGSTISIDIGAAGMWTWRREHDHWSVVDGAAATPAVCIRVPPERTVAVLSRGVTPDEFAEAITLTGDESIARDALDVITPLVGRPDA